MLQQNTIGNGVRAKRENERKKRLKRLIEPLRLQIIQPFKTWSYLIWEYKCTNQTHGSALGCTSTTHGKGLWTQQELPLGRAGVQSWGDSPAIAEGKTALCLLKQEPCSQVGVQVTVMLTVSCCFICKPWSPIQKEVTNVFKTFAV